jgi:hypothetical protein
LFVTVMFVSPPSKRRFALVVSRWWVKTFPVTTMPLAL